MARCADSNCGYYWQEEGEAYPRCHYDDPWPAPCEYDDYEEKDESPIPDTFWEELYPSCSTCYNRDEDTPDKVACCNCCEDYSFYTPID